MNSSTVIRSLLVPSAVIIAVGVLSGCSLVQDVVSSSVTTTADSREKLSGDVPQWIPDDATAITRVEGARGDAASILLSSTKDLDADVCVATPRLSAPTLQVENAPDVYGEDEVFSCGDWAVMHSSDGWYGWTPASESTAVPTPAASR
jgi:outer membrane murein-binding lipoprotein Lpp